ncbi:LytTR family DNA-binding domain-containing protein [Paenibacillus sp. Marseille-Q4541]|uniref:LytR/AlgR family response regulator transcription factor n=1 Tax=Paenibacillus sp. Marseille-Q4541 TaxID=2831522 RepID=UPI001BAE08A2|nr:LytTR family DNA-binding domain-containing protein [Paenibacillus sp. Marseille-Q4541]
MNILIAEDEPHIEKLLVSCVQEVAPAAAVYTTGRSSEALNIAHNQAIDLFILDIQLEDYKGTQLAHELRSMERYSYTPIVFATALANEELTAYRQIKCYSFLIKPFTKEEVINVMRDTVRYSQHLALEERQTPKMLRIEQKSYIFEYEQDHIVYIESFGKHLELHVKSAKEGDIRSDRISGLSLKKMTEMLSDDTFVQCHKSYIINSSYISKIDKSEGLVELTGVREAIPIGNKFRDALISRGSV